MKLRIDDLRAAIANLPDHGHVIIEVDTADHDAVAVNSLSAVAVDASRLLSGNLRIRATTKAGSATS